MLLLYNNLIRFPVVSLQTGQTVAAVDDCIIESRELNLIGFWCRQKQTRDTLLLGRDLKFIAKDCLAVDDERALSNPADIVRLPHITRISYALVGKKVVTVSGQKLGVVKNFAISLSSGQVQKIYVKPSLWQSIRHAEFIINRSQVNELAQDQITVLDADNYTESSVTAKASLTSP